MGSSKADFYTKWGDIVYKIFIVEDDKALCNNIKEGISKWGYEGIVVENFEDILQGVAKHNPHLYGYKPALFWWILLVQKD